ncbi:hypothetical protein CL656_06835 [bacterium]|nr:hypothetical protein [bacterium]|tara:strand:- start:3115 stop:3810 length:696 start_codon:yes stop_codon:yes gene_type:complete
MKIAVVTSISGGKEKLPFINKIENINYFSFLNKKDFNTALNSGWDPIEIPSSTFYNKFKHRREAKIAKVLLPYLLPNYDVYIWHDPYCELKQELIELIYQSDINKYDVLCFTHRFRKNPSEEIFECLKARKDSFYKLCSYWIELKKRGHTKLPLYELTSFVLFNTPEVRKLSLLWWEDICRFSSRDQLSFPSSVKRSGCKNFILPGYANGIEFRHGESCNMFIPQVRNHFV